MAWLRSRQQTWVDRKCRLSRCGGRGVGLGLGTDVDVEVDGLSSIVDKIVASSGHTI